MLANSFGNICKFPRRGMVGGPGGSPGSLLPTFLSLRYAQAIAVKNASSSKGPIAVEVISTESVLVFMKLGTACGDKRDALSEATPCDITD
jgi:hypothetical protein